MRRTLWTLHFALCDNKLLAVPVPWLVHIPIPAMRKQMDCFFGFCHFPSISEKGDQFFLKTPVTVLSFLSLEWGSNAGNFNTAISSGVRLKGDACLCILGTGPLKRDGWAEGPDWKNHWAGGTGGRGIGLEQSTGEEGRSPENQHWWLGWDQPFFLLLRF